MKIYWKDQRGAHVFLADSQHQPHARGSAVTDPSVKIMVGDNGIFFQATDDDVFGFSLTVRELEALLKEVTAHEKHKVVACYRNEETGGSWYEVEPEGGYKAPREGISLNIPTNQIMNDAWPRKRPTKCAATSLEVLSQEKDGSAEGL